MTVINDARLRVATGRRTVAWPMWYRRWAMAIDFTAALAGALVAFFIRFPDAVPEMFYPYAALTVSLPILWMIFLAANRAYEPRLFGVGWEEFRRVLSGGFMLTAAVAITAYSIKVQVARGYVILALPLAMLLDLAGRYRLRKRLHALRWRGECMRRVVVLGHRGAVGDLVALLKEKRYHGMDIVAACLPGAPDIVSSDVNGVPVLGDFTNAAHVVEAVGADSVAVLACPEMDGLALRRLAWQIEKDDVELIVAPALMEVAGPRISIRPVAGLPLLHVEHPELEGTRQAAKAIFDRVTAFAGLAVLSPVLLTIAAAIRLTSQGPALFTQTRVGKGGREFKVYKFRTMVQNAEELREELLGDNENDGVLFKIKSDPRVTGIGGRLRRYSLDELPQLINVLRGEMSLVGPRPPLPEEVAQYGDDVRRRLVVQPGLTGLWQVSGRSDLTWEESVRIDLRYVENWSLMLDLLILWKTASAVFKGDGAY
jgi:exopolysaccharide biosynthesis polyprenyl glycosylphosphotransferase